MNRFLKCSHCKAFIEKLTVDAACSDGLGHISICCPECETEYAAFDVPCDSVGAFQAGFDEATAKNYPKLIPLVVSGKRKAHVAAGIFNYIRPMVEQQFFTKGGDGSGDEKAQDDQEKDS